MNNKAFDSLGEGEELSRSQMKNILGGLEDVGGKCKTSSCSLTEWVEFSSGGGYWETNNGSCDQHDATGNCFCDLGTYEEVPLGSNGGVSRCTNGTSTPPTAV